MKQLYPLSFSSLLLLFIFSSCSKDVLKPYDERIIGTWRIDEIDTHGMGGSSRTLPFNEGELSFYDDGRLVYVRQGQTYQGSWDLRKINRATNCTTNNGSATCTERNQVLQLTAVDFSAQNVRTEYFDDIDFTGTGSFKGYIHSGAKTYVVKFVRL